jgi:predicted ferric reductase
MGLSVVKVLSRVLWHDRARAASRGPAPPRDGQVAAIRPANEKGILLPAAALCLLYLALVGAPLALAALQDTAPRQIWDELATGAGLAGLAILLVEFALSGRFRTISGRIGMDVTMRLHQLLARTAAGLLLLHPFLYRGRQQLDPRQAPPGADTLDYGLDGLWPGIVAWLLLGALMVMAIGRDGLYRHELWRLGHGAMALAVAGLGVLHATRAGRYSADPVLAWFWTGLFGVAVASLLWVYLAKPLMKHRRPWRVTGVQHLADRTWELTLSPDGHDGLRFAPGQFAWISIGHGAFSLNENPFSIASAPGAGPDLRFVIKELGDFTRRIGDIPTGTPAHVDAPFGALTLDGHRDVPGICLVAGGVGIAPMLSHLREMALDSDPRPRLLVYANRSPSQVVHGDELDRMARETPLELVHVLSEPPPGWQGETGLVTRDLLERHLDAAARRDWVFVLCGPPPMLHAVETALLEMGVPARNILSEQFSYD